MYRYFFIFLVIFISGGFVVNAFDSVILYPVIVFVLIVGIFIRVQVHIDNVALLRAFALLMLFVILLYVRGESLDSGDNIQIVLKIIIAATGSFYLAQYGKIDFIVRYIKLIEFLIVVSLVVFVLANLMPGLLYQYSSVEHLTGHPLTWMGVGYFRSNDYIKYGFLRNQSVFWEPGVFSVFVILSYIFRYYIVRFTGKRWLYLTAIISTFSLGGIIIFTVLFIFEFLRSSRLWKMKYGAPLIVFAIIFFGIGMGLFSAVFPDALVKLVAWLFHRNIKMDSSVQTRLSDLILGLRAGASHWLIGNGKNYGSFYDLMMFEEGKSKAFYNGGITNSITSMFYAYGLVFTLFYIYFLARVSMLAIKGGRIIIFFALIGCLMLEPLFVSVFFLLLIVWLPDSVGRCSVNKVMNRCQC